MNNHSRRKNLLIRIIGALILSTVFVAPALNQSTSSQVAKTNVFNITPSKLLEKVRKKIQVNPKISTAEVTDFANSILEKNGYNYAFDVCEFIGIPRVSEPSQNKFYRGYLFSLDGSKHSIRFSGVQGGMCSECFANFPIHKLTVTRLDLLVGGKVYQFKRPKEFTLDQMDLMDATMKKVIRSWEVPDQDVPDAISEDGKTLYLKSDFTNYDKYPGFAPFSKSGKKPKQKYPYSLIALSGNGLKFVEAKPILTKQKSEDILNHPIDPNNSYQSFRRFRVGTKSFIVRYSSPCI